LRRTRGTSGAFGIRPLDFENASASKVGSGRDRWLVSIPERGAPGIALGLRLGLDVEVDLETGECTECEMECPLDKRSFVDLPAARSSAITSPPCLLGCSSSKTARSTTAASAKHPTRVRLPACSIIVAIASRRPYMGVAGVASSRSSTPLSTSRPLALLRASKRTELDPSTPAFEPGSAGSAPPRGLKPPVLPHRTNRSERK
jgi:hypothetical protein